jgi:hypothetical protein
MALFDLFKPKKKPTSQSNTLSVMPERRSVANAAGNIAFHPDLEGLLWIADGALQNYYPEKDAVVNEGMLRIFISTAIEPSAITFKAPITKPSSKAEIPRPPYYPSYGGITPEQRWIYLEFLKNPYSEIDIGYVFLLYYGLERHLLLGDFEKAFNVILKLRHGHRNSSFLSYSSSALLLSCVKHQKIEYAKKFLAALDETQISSINVSLFLLCLHSFGLPLTPKVLMIYAKSFALENTRYIKNNPEIFVQELAKAMQERTGKSSIELSDYAKDIWKIKSYSFRAFANTSLSGDDNNVDIPDLATVIKLTSLCNNLLNEAHENTKAVLRELRKSVK